MITGQMTQDASGALPAYAGAAEGAVSLASHELKTPLAVVMVALQALEMEGGPELSAKAREFLGMARRNAERLQGLIDRYLSLSRVEGGAEDLRRERVELRPFVEKSIADLAPVAARRGVRIELVGDAGTVLADAGRLDEVLANLLSNAIKFSPDGETVTVSLSEWEGFARVAVADRGPGIAEDFKPRVFLKFARDGRNGVAGTGLGLALAKELVERMGGGIGFASEPGQGAIFRFTLPVWSGEPFVS